MFPVAVLLLLAAGSYVECERLTQPTSVTVQPGQTLTINCQVSYSVSSYYTDWVRQPAGKGLEWIGTKYTGEEYYKESLKNKFSIDLDTSSNTVTLKGQNMQPGDTAVYYCARVEYGSSWVPLDYWGQGTKVTVTSATPNAPTVFPLMPCDSGTGTKVTLGCLAKDFTPSSLTFTWTKDGAGLTGSIQYPPVLKNQLYTGLSQIEVDRQEWESNKAFQCAVSHQAGTEETVISKPKVLYSTPELKVSTYLGEQNEASFFCFATNFSPKDYQIKWLKNEGEVSDVISEIKTPLESKKTDDGILYTVASILLVDTKDLDKSTITCKFEGKNAAGAEVTKSSVVYKSKPAKGCTAGDVDVEIEGPTAKEMFIDMTGSVKCHVTAKMVTVTKIFWENVEERAIPGASTEIHGKGPHYTASIDITYDEWSQGIKLICVVETKEILEKIRTPYERRNGGLPQRPSVFMMPPVEHFQKDTVTLTCYVKDFYPQDIFISWLVDDEYSSGDKYNTTEPIEYNGSYSVYGQLSLSVEQWKKEGVMYSCVIYHQSVVNSTKAIVRSIGYKTFEKTNLVNLHMNIPCKA